MKRVLAMICLAAVIMGILVSARTEGPSARMRSYGAGKYQVGKNLDAGEYILFSAPMRTGFFAVLADEDTADVISKGSFDANTILTVEEGDDLIISDCFAIFADDYYSMNRIKLNQFGGMFKVGVDVQPGKYTLLAQPGQASVYRIYNNSRFRFTIEEKTFQGTCRVTLEENQYLELIKCSFDPRFLPTPVPTPTPQPTPSPQPTATPAPETEGGDSTDQADTAKDEKPFAGTNTDAPDASRKKKKTDPNETDPSTNRPPDETPAPAPISTLVPDTTPIPAPDATPAKKQKIRIDSRRSPAVRSMPSTMGNKIAVAQAGKEYELLGIDGKWYKIVLPDGTIGWVIRNMAEIVD